MPKTNIKTDIRIGFAIVFAVMLIVTLYLFRQMRAIERDTALLYEHPYQVSNTTKDIKIEFLKTARLVRDIELTDNQSEVDSLKNEIDSYDKNVYKGFKIISSLYLGNKQDIYNAYNDFATWKNSRNIFYELKKENKNDSIEYFIKTKTRKQFDKFILHLKVVSDFAKNKGDKIFKQVIKRESTAIYYSIVFLVISSMIAMFFIWYLSRHITRPIKKFVDEANALMQRTHKTGQKIDHDETLLLLTLEELKIAYQDIERQSKEIDDHNKLLADLNLELEDKVKHRTLALQTTVEKLEEEIYFRKKTEEALQKSEALLNATGNTAKVGGWEIDLELQTLTWTNEVYRIHEVDKSFRPTVEGAINFYAPAALPVISQAVQKAIEEGEAFDLELQIVTATGALRWVHAVGNAIMQNGKAVKVVGTFQDINDRKEVEEQLLETMTKLELSNKELEQFAYVASHDLQEPLRMVSSYTQLLAKRYKDKLDSDAQEFIEFAVGGTKRMQTLINDLLEYSRLNTRKKPLIMTDCHALLGHVRSNLEVMVTEENAVITSDTLPRLMADESQLTQLLQNLIGNGIKYQGSDPPHVHVSAKEEKNEWIFSVKDNGIGIAKEFHERIFKIFQRLHAKEEYSGTGIGLAICKRIVERHGGRIWLESEPGKGSVFYFSIPK